MEKMKVGVVGATGMVGQRFLTLLENHPYFEVTALAASANSAGKTYEDAVGSRWKLETPMPEKYQKMVDEICKRMNFTSLQFNRLEDLIEAIGLEPCKLCTYCFNGKE